jgi:hypothetical protein
MVSIDVMLAQLPPHAVAKKVDNYEHLDLLWGKDVDKVVFPHVLEFLRTYAEPIPGSKAAEAETQSLETEPPAYSKTNVKGLRKRDPTRRVADVQEASGQDHAKRVEGVSYAQVAAENTEDHDPPKRVEGVSYAQVAAENIDDEDHSKRVDGISYAQVAAEGTEHESDSDQTMGEEHHDTVQSDISFADALKAHPRDDSGTTAVEETAPGIDKPVTEDISYADMAAK